MLPTWLVLLAALLYLTGLFAVAYLGDRIGPKLMSGRLRPAIYALTISVYCTSWTFLGSVGLASRNGYDFLAIYIGPILVLGFAGFLLSRIVRLAESQNSTSIADFVGARYGKNQTVAAVVSIICVIAVVPYAALQLKAISASLEVFIAASQGGVQPTAKVPLFGDISLLVALILAFFAIAFGTRQIDATEHQDGLMIAIAMESVIKLVAFLTVGGFVVFWIFGGLSDLSARVAERADILAVFNRAPDGATFLTMTLLAAIAIVLLPRQFHVMVVENRRPDDLRSAAWMFPLYLVTINLFVIPIAMAGLLLLPAGVDRDMTVLLVPLMVNADMIAILALIGGLSAATAMVIVECVALAIMISNDLFMPILLRRRLARAARSGENGPISGHPMDIGSTILAVRRIAIVVILLLSYAYYRASGEAALSAIGLLAFAAIAQIAPAFFIGLYWRRANAAGAIAGLVGGLLVWSYTLLLPSLAGSGGLLADLVARGPLGIQFLSPTRLFGLEMEPLVQGVLLSLTVNVLLLVTVSLTRLPTAIERIQANFFVAPDDMDVGQSIRLWRAAVSHDELRQTVSRYLGEERTHRAFDEHFRTRGETYVGARDADPRTLRFSEHLLASAIGASSSRLVLSLLLRRRNLSTKAAMRLLDDASSAIEYNRTLLQNALDHAGQAVTVFDRDLRLVAWNRAFHDMFALPEDLMRIGVGLDEIVAFNVRRGVFGREMGDDTSPDDLRRTLLRPDPLRIRLDDSQLVIEVRTNALPDGGLVTTYTDVTPAVRAEEALARANDTLERRVRERTEELTEVNAELSAAKRVADEANLSKTRFLAAASHDILQPLNAARLYTSSLVDKLREDENTSLIARNVDASLDSVEEIITTLLDISRLDSGAMKPELTVFRLDALFQQLQVEFEPIARERGLRLRFVPCGLSVRSDRRLLRRLAQNLISNGLKYTTKGGVVVGCRRSGRQVRLMVVDSGIGIPEHHQKRVFDEFRRLDDGARIARGLGLGLSIVDRLARLLDHPLAMRSVSGKGTSFAITMPISTMTAPDAAPEPVAVSGGSLAALTVLCVDNEPAILDGMRMLLGGWGCRVLTAENRAAALAHLDARPDVALVDYHLDHDTGTEIIAALRAASQVPLEAFLVTADRTAALRAVARDSGIGILNKPVKPAALRAALSRIGLTRIAAE
jgi:Na+/proline symporter/CheY-like chemotaxis protein/two-component sensor histidine kinase